MFKAIRLAGQMMNYAPGHQAIRADDVTLVAASDLGAAQSAYAAYNM